MEGHPWPPDHCRGLHRTPEGRISGWGWAVQREGGRALLGRAGPASCKLQGAGARGPRLCTDSSGTQTGHGKPVAGAMRAGRAVALGPRRLPGEAALLSGPGPHLLRGRLEAGQGVWKVLLRPGVPWHRRLLL